MTLPVFDTTLLVFLYFIDLTSLCQVLLYNISGVCEKNHYT